jgi:septal ring factor EnvC (AmiA/AmiB activator)
MAQRGWRQRRCWRLLPALLACAVAMPALAATTQDRNAATAHRLHRQVDRDRQQVTRLQQGVAQQESRSREAAARLRQQDDTIARLKRQLQALQAPSPSTSTGH